MSLAIKSARAGARSMPRGGPAMGDPGLFGFLKGAVKTVGSFLTGGPVAAVGTAVSQIQGASGPGVPPIVRPPSALQVPGGRIPTRVNPLGFGPPGVGLSVGERFATNGAVGTQIKCASGFHPNKSSYFLKDGTFVPKGSRCVKNRRRNPMNPRALDRAIGRMDSAKRLQSKLREFETSKFTKAGKEKC